MGHHPLEPRVEPGIGDRDLRVGGSGRAADWPAIRRGVAEVREAARPYLAGLTEPDLDLVIPFDGSVLALRAQGLSLRHALLVNPVKPRRDLSALVAIR